MITKKLRSIFNQQFGDDNNAIIAMAPGRINLIGEHTDYNDGFVLPMTIDRAAYFALRRRNDDQCRVYSCNFNELATWQSNNITKEQNFHWSNYIKGMQKILLDDGQKIGGFEGVIYGDVPIGSGLSSSAALEVVTAYALQQIFKFEMSAVKMIQLAQKAENDFVGVSCGIMDQFVSRLGKSNHALFIDCRTLDYHDVPLKITDHVLLIANTKIKRELAKSAYNERCDECATAVKHFQKFDPKIKKLRDVNLSMFEKHSAGLPDNILRRARHVISENQRVLDAVVALTNGNLKKLGELFYSSHQSLREDYAVSCAELDFLVDQAKVLGALGARLTGAGFGGSVIMLVKKTDADNISDNLFDNYAKQFGSEPAITILERNYENKTYSW